MGVNNKGFAQMPIQFLESISNDDAMTPVHRVLAWYYRKMYGWEKHRQQGYFEVMKFTSEAKSINMAKQTFMGAFHRLEKTGYFSHSVIKKHDKFCHIITCHPVIKKHDKRVIKKHDKLSYKNMTGNRVVATTTGDSKTLNKYKEINKENRERKSTPLELNFVLSQIKDFTVNTCLENIPDTLITSWFNDFGGQKVLDAIKLLLVKQSKRQLNELGYHTIQHCLERNWMSEPLNKSLLEDVNRYLDNNFDDVDYVEPSDIDKEVIKRAAGDPFADIKNIRREVIKEFKEREGV